jgi:hypothetical protein
MPGATNSRDRLLVITAAAVLLLGVLAFGIGLWVVLRPGGDLSGPGEGRLGAGLVGGPVLIGLAIAELERRRRHGPQDPGRHSSS